MRKPGLDVKLDEGPMRIPDPGYKDWVDKLPRIKPSFLDEWAKDHALICTAPWFSAVPCDIDPIHEAWFHLADLHLECCHLEVPIVDCETPKVLSLVDFRRLIWAVPSQDFQDRLVHVLQTVAVTDPVQDTFFFCGVQRLEVSNPVDPGSKLPLQFLAVVSNKGTYATKDYTDDVGITRARSSWIPPSKDVVEASLKMKKLIQQGEGDASQIVDEVAGASKNGKPRPNLPPGHHS